MRKFFFVISLFAFAAVSCTDPKYVVDEAHPVNSQVTVFQDEISLPVGSAKPLLLKDLLKLETNEYFYADPDGDLQVSYVTKTPLKYSFKVEQKTAPKFNVNTVEFNRKMSVAGQTTTYDVLVELTQDAPIGFSVNLPVNILDAEYIEVSQPVKINMGVSVGSAEVKKGFRIELPEWLEASTKESFLSMDGKNVFVFNQNVSFSATKSFNINIDKVIVVPGSIKDQVLTMNGKVLPVGEVRLYSLQAINIPEKIKFYTEFKAENGSIKYASVKVNESKKVDDTEFSIGALPSIIKSVNLDVLDPVFYLNVDNASVTGLFLDATISSFKGGKKCGSVSVKDYPISPVSKQTLYICKSTNTSIPEGPNKIVDDGISKLLSSYPDKFLISDIIVRTNSGEFFRVEGGKTYNVTVAYGFDTELSLAKGSYIDFDYKMSSFNFEIGDDILVKHLDMTFNAESTIPLECVLDAKLYDAQGQEIPDIDVEVEGKVAPGSMAQPVTSPILVKIISKNGIRKINGLSLVVSGTVIPEYEGVPINNNQSLRIYDIVLSAKEGITLAEK